MKKQTIVISALFCSLLFACTPEEEAGDGDDNTPTGQTISELAGNHQKCYEFDSTVGSEFSGKAYVVIYWLNQDGTFAYEIRFSDADTCATEFGSGGDEVAVYEVSGTFTADGAADNLEEATKVTFNVEEVKMTIRTDAQYENGLEFAQHLNTCNPAPNFATDGSASVRTFSGNVCAQNGSFAFPTPVAAGDTYVNIVEATGTHFNVGGTENIYAPGSTTHPTEFADQLVSF